MLYPDISHYHPVTDWNKVKENCGFLISKATEGQTYVDPTLEDFIAGCEDNNIPYWLYAYLKKGNEKAQAEFLVSTCGDKVGVNFVGYVLDAESNNAAADVLEAMNYLIDTGNKTMLYTGYSDYSKYEEVILSIPTTGAWWEARYGLNNGMYSDAYPCHDGVSLHQYTSKGVCDGIDGECDLNRIVRKDEEWFRTPEAVSAKTSGSISVDGKWGKNTTKKLQEVLGTTVDGIVSHQYKTYKSDNPGLMAATFQWEKNPSGCSQVIKALQKKIGMASGDQDGHIGPATIKALQKYYGTTQDGVISKPSQVVKAMQTALNSGKV